jgi:hypothetical protein
MVEHIVIRREEYVAGTRHRPEVGIFTQTHSRKHPIPWGRITIGDLVWMKWSGGPIVAKARIHGFRQIENCTPEMLRTTTYGYKLHGLEDYWNHLPSVFYGMAIYLNNEEWIEHPFEPPLRSYGDSWIILSDSLTYPSAIEIPDGNPGNEQNTARSRSRVIKPSVRFEIFRRDNFTCQYCGRKAPEVRLQVDHIVAWSRGGSNDISNLVTSCVECNIGKGARVIG